MPDPDNRSPEGHQTTGLVPGSRLREVWRASNDRFGDLIRASGVLEGTKQQDWCPIRTTGVLKGTKQRDWCPDLGSEKSGGHQTIALVT
ncbi:hypothetical protein [Ammoniphilus sp. YIM 78166]|uniref:hypothetical protein n=1 Tax=Ammoniphilus sp. YIM 78166 TaxID=1644106 RepID=UPI00142F7BBF|nr:hypothetical protein [Ammoniphilus sp. YIM 78166]